MAITLRTDKGSALTHSELDENFVTLQDEANNLQNQVSNLPTLGANTFIGNQVISGSLKVTNGITGSVTQAVSAQTGSKLSITNESDDSTEYRVLFTGTPTNITEGATVPAQVLLDPTKFTYNPSTGLLSVTASAATTSEHSLDTLSVKGMYEGNMASPSSNPSMSTLKQFYTQVGTAPINQGTSNRISMAGIGENTMYSVIVTPVVDATANPPVVPSCTFYVAYEWNAPENGFFIKASDSGDHAVMYTVHYTV